MSYVCLGLLLRPASPMRLAPVAGQPLLWRGAYHVHTTRSDGSGTPEEVAAAAAAAGLQFVILTDHGDGTRAPDPPRYVDGVLLIDGVEISTDAGHYVAIGMRQTPFPLGGEARGVAEDVMRFGGLRFIAHPDSPRPSLAWQDRSVRADGFEWLNADSIWRGANSSQLLSRLALYPFNRAGALTGLASYPTHLLERYDTPAAATGRLALAAVDAHARVGWRRDADPLDGGRTIARFPSYRALFGTFGIVAPWIGGAPSGRPQQDADAILHFLRNHATYNALFSMADTPFIDFEAVADGGALGGPRTDRALTGPGGPFDRHRSVRGDAALRVRTNAPPGATIRVRRNGGAWREGFAPSAEFEVAAADPMAVYRAEVWLPPHRGWPLLPAAVSQAIVHNAAPPPEFSYRRLEKQPVIVTSWHGEHDPHSSVSLVSSSAIASASLALAEGARVSQFAAVVADLSPPPPGATTLTMRLRSDAPMRLSVQLREPRAGDGLRWRRSMFVGPGGDLGYFEIDDFLPIAPAAGPVPLDRAHALLFVLDTVNARPGTRRTVTIEELSWVVTR